MPRDPADLARIAPEALQLVETLDALYSLLELVEEDEARWCDPATLPLYRQIQLTSRHARACWDELIRRDSPQEIAALKQIAKYKKSNGTAAEINNYSISGDHRRDRHGDD